MAASGASKHDDSSDSDGSENVFLAEDEPKPTVEGQQRAVVSDTEDDDNSDDFGDCRPPARRRKRRRNYTHGGTAAPTQAACAAASNESGDARIVNVDARIIDVDADELDVTGNDALEPPPNALCASSMLQLAEMRRVRRQVEEERRAREERRRNEAVAEAHDESAPGSDEDEDEDGHAAGSQAEAHIRIKARFDDGSDMVFRMSCSDAFAKMEQAIAARKGVDLAKVRLEFDGMVIGSDQTPTSLDLEDDDLIDIILLSDK
ncbi:Small ubiquitin-related modifier [Porphyridium purpureum]|uniref:Small ubiquitin-related modifier n=1 Tax=Porphyridium purpureum TaxID=35688 RepID=A0A5J4Z3V2_PORPP|nr:Small ubiquitin-related modifier [Porphyridium purpureum]|eukprot:POR4186..scf295_1